MWHYFLHLSVIAIVSSHDIEVHERMTPEEVQSIFKTDHDTVPEYEVVQTAHAVHENSPKDSIHRILHLKSLKRDIKLYLEPIEGILVGKHTPVWKAQGDRSSPAGIKYTRVANTMDDGSHFYQDPYNLAAFYSTSDEHGEILFEGTIGDDLVVRALPRRLRKVLSRNKRSVSEDYFTFSNRTVTHANLRQTYDHIVFKNKEVNHDGIREKLGSHILEKEFVRRKRQDTYVQPPRTVYPQVLVIVDHSHFQSLQTFSEVKRYVISFWNAVDLRYRIFVDPEVRLNIAGIIVATDPNGVPYIQNHRTRPLDGPIIDADKALDHMGNYFFAEQTDPKLKRFVMEKDFDLAITMTQLNLCNLDPDDNDFDCTTLGYAFRQGACTITPSQKIIQAVGLVEDNGGYIGIVPAAHEVGHLMGARHDGNELDEYDQPKCPAYKGHIMAGMLTCTENVFRWSTCSMEDFNNFFHHVRSECLFNEPQPSRPLRRILPGKIYSLDEQCDRIEGTRACNKDESACIHLECLVPGSGGRCHTRAPAAEGSECGQKHHCINGKCVHKNTTEVVLELPSETESPIDYDEYPSIDLQHD